ncbi:hypothetical protein PENTCL1PPCAC_17178, partial [Pristionchus entomophagus]
QEMNRVESCIGRVRRCKGTRKFEAFVMDGPLLIALSHTLSLLSVWNELPPRPSAAFIIEVKSTEPSICVLFKRDVDSHFEELRRFTWEEWQHLSDEQ